MFSDGTGGENNFWSNQRSNGVNDGQSSPLDGRDSGAISDAAYAYMDSTHSVGGTIPVPQQATHTHLLICHWAHE